MFVKVFCGAYVLLRFFCILHATPLSEPSFLTKSAMMPSFMETCVYPEASERKEILSSGNNGYMHKNYEKREPRMPKDYIEEIDVIVESDPVYILEFDYLKNDPQKMDVGKRHTMGQNFMRREHIESMPLRGYQKQVEFYGPMTSGVRHFDMKSSVDELGCDGVRPMKHHLNHKKAAKTHKKKRHTERKRNQRKKKHAEIKERELDKKISSGLRSFLFNALETARIM